LFEALISSMVSGVDVADPIPGTPALGVDDIDQSVDSADARRESEDC
jgi:hypothetical protein